MPIYAYRCRECSHELEALQKLSEDPLTLCPECNQEALRKSVTAPAFRLKGSGWYETDFKSSGKRNVADSGSSGGSSTGGSPDGGSSSGASAS